jgi:hypothetical protein
MKKAMKVLAISMCLIFGLTLVTGCETNQSLFDTNYKFDYALVNEKGTWVKYEVKKWDDYENDAICIWTKDGKVIYTSMNNVVLYGDN